MSSDSDGQPINMRKVELISSSILQTLFALCTPTEACTVLINCIGHVSARAVKNRADLDSNIPSLLEDVRGCILLSWQDLVGSGAVTPECALDANGQVPETYESDGEVATSAATHEAPRRAQ